MIVPGVGRLVPGFPRRFRAEKFQFMDMENEFPGDRAIMSFVSLRFRAALQQKFHAFDNVCFELLSSLTPDLSADPIGELLFPDAAAGSQ